MNRTIIGLTGGIGSGKSTVANHLRNKGVLVLDADQYSREALEPNAACFSEVVSLFGTEILDEAGRIQRQVVAKAIFSDEKKRKQLNDIVHPYVLSCLKRDTETGDELVVWEVPLLFESGLDRYCDEVWTVSASEETRIERVIRRDGCSRAAAKKRILAQATEEERNERADVILRNDGDVSTVIRAVDERLNARRKLP